MLEIGLLHLYCFVPCEIFFRLAMVGYSLDGQPCERLRDGERQ